MLLSEILNKLQKFDYVTENVADDVEITGICPCSSRVEPGNLYIAIEGLHADGHLYIGEALKRGASAVAVTRSAVESKTVDAFALGVPTLICEDTRVASSRLFSVFYGEPQKEMKMIGVTGTNGKTSTCRLIYEILTRSSKKCALIGTMGCLISGKSIDIRPADPRANMTTPDPEELYKILRAAVDDGAEFAVMEVTSHALALVKVEPIVFDTAIFTNLSEDHLDFHGDMQGYFAAKRALLSQSRRAVINYDDRYGRLLAETIDIPARLCSAEGRERDVAAEDIRLIGEKGIEYKLTSRDLRLRIRSPLPGGFNVMNTMQAAIVAHSYGASAADIKETLAHFCGAIGRLERLKLEDGCDFSVFIDYAHTPDALENLLRTARGFAKDGQRIVLLFGCGGDRDRQKRPIMGKIATGMADHVIITGDNSRSERTEDIISEIISGIERESAAPFIVIENRKDAIEYAVKNARRGDIILLAGKGHEEYEIDREGKKPFSERNLVAEFIKKYYS